jgi:hypothetical protein
MLRAMKTTLGGYLYCRNHADERIRRRSKNYEERLKMMRYFLTASTIFVQNRQSETLLREIKQSYRTHFGKMNFPTLVKSMTVVLFSIKEYLRCRIVGDLRVPKTSYRPLNKVQKYGDKRAKSSYADGLNRKLRTAGPNNLSINEG